MSKSTPRKYRKIKVALLVALLSTLLVSYYALDLGRYFSLEWLKANGKSLLMATQENFTLYGTIYFIAYVIITGVSLPGAAVMTLAGGYLFGLLKGTLLVSFASTIGASLAFLASRFLFGDWVQKKFRAKMVEIKEGIEREGKIYLFSLRLIPIFPFFLINLVMGLTPMKLSSFYLVSQIGMLPGTIVYVNAGTRLAKIDTLKEVLSPEILLSFVLLGIFPILANFAFSVYKTRLLYKKYPRPKKFDYNMLVIGAGSGGLVASYIAATLKAKVALVEKNLMGGDCLNTGCVPSKALIKSAKAAHMAKKGAEFGVESKETKVDFAKVMERVHKVIKKIEPHDSIERYTALGVECIQGAAQIISPFEVEVEGKKLTTKNIIVATGATPLVPPIPGVENIKYYTSETLWGLKELPEKLLVLGGGPIGCEMAQAFSRLGSEVSIVEKGSRVLRVEDEDVSVFLERQLKNEGVKVLTDCKAVSFEANGDGNILIHEIAGDKKRLEFTHAIFALGRKANTKGFGLEELGVSITPKGTVSHNRHMQTNFPNIYVCGDVAGPFQFTHAASHQAWYASVNAIFSPFAKFKADYRVLPWCTFVDPEIARVGINEQEANERGIQYDLTVYHLNDLDRAITDSEDQGFVKVITEKGKDKILGACVVGARGADIIAEFALAMKHGIGLNKILSTVHLYPSYSEALKFAAGQWKKERKPARALAVIEIFNRWRRS